MKYLWILPFVVIAVCGTFGAKYYNYVTNGQSPYDETGIALSGYMPSPVRVRGCVRLWERFPKALPPYGCADVWRRLS
jgi:hypothetical protein